MSGSDSGGGGGAGVSGMTSHAPPALSFNSNKKNILAEFYVYRLNYILNMLSSHKLKVLRQYNSEIGTRGP